MEKLRVQKFIAQSGMCSRRKAEELIKKGMVTVNGKPVKLGDQCSEKDEIRVSGRRVKTELAVPSYFVMNKPRSFVCSRSDPHNAKTVFDLLKGRDKLPNLFTVGRLDKDTTGLLIITNDGTLSQEVIHPSSKIRKYYLAVLDKPLKDVHKKKLEGGVRLEGIQLAPCTITKKGSMYEIVIMEGRKRQIRKMFETLGYRVTKLHRERIGGLKLKPFKLDEGQYKKVDRKVMEQIF